MTTVWLSVCQWLLIFGIVSSQDPADCINSRAKNGKCVPINLCPRLQDLAQRSVISDRDRNFLRANICDRDKKYVCCVQPLTDSKGRKMTLPGTDVCGYGGAADKIFGGSETNLDQYRWMVVVERLEKGLFKVICGGALINTLYVLSAAHCFNGERNPENLQLRLGEHDLRTDPDCEEDSLTCNYVVKASVSDIIIHPKYRRELNDIALLKLSAPIQYADHVLPICLPVLPAQQEDFINHKVYAAGWGRNETDGAMNQVKMHVQLQVTDLEECADIFISRSLSEMHMCAKSVENEIGDTCKGDSGGPLMIQLQGHWYHVGVVNSGAVCGMPAIYARTSHHMGWIQDNLLE